MLLAAIVAHAVITLAPAAPPDPAAEARALMRAQKYAEAAIGLGEYVGRNPYDGRAWWDLGYSLHVSGDYDGAEAAYLEALELGVRPETLMYNIACLHALRGHTDAAFDWLRRAIEARFAEQDTLESDTDLDSIRSDPRFFELTGLNPPPLEGRRARWAADLAFMTRRMEQMHWDLYGRVSREEFAAAVAEIVGQAAAAPEAVPDGHLRAGLIRLLARVGDGHTGLGIAVNETTVPRFPLHLFDFDDGLHVLGAPADRRDLVGARVLAIAGVAADEAMARVRPYCSVDNDMGHLAIGPGRLVNPLVLGHAGLIDDPRACDYTLALRDGSTTTVTLPAVDAPAGGHGGLFNPAFTYVHQLDGASTPPYLGRPTERHWMIDRPEHKLVYFNFSAVQDDRDQTLAAACDELFALVESSGADRLVIDMRFNGGGNTGLLRPLLLGLVRAERVNRHGSLFVITGRHTFSAAQNCVNMMEQMTNATFVGEPAGSRPAFIGESTSFVLPYSRLRVFCSSRYWQFGDSTDQRTWVQPQIPAPPTFAAYAAGRDDAMEAILAAIGGPSSP